MRDLQLLGPHQDGKHLTLNDAEGNRYLLPINDELRAALKEAKVICEQTAPAGLNTNLPASSMRPREIQELFRSGLSLEEVAARSGMDPDRLEVYQTPVIAERNYTVQRAKETPVGPAEGPTLLEIVTSRLATHGVYGDKFKWDAVKPAHSNWIVTLTYALGGESVEAKWSIDLESRKLTALDDNSRLLSETQLEPVNNTSLFPPSASAERTSEKPGQLEEDDYDRTLELLKQLDAHRGTRVPVILEDDEDDDLQPLPFALELEQECSGRPDDSGETDTTPAKVFNFQRSRSASNIQVISPDEVETGAESKPLTLPTALNQEEKAEKPQLSVSDPQAQPEPKNTKKRTGRRSVPSWDEIVFGAKKD